MTFEDQIIEFYKIIKSINTNFLETMIDVILLELDHRYELCELLKEGLED